MLTIALALALQTAPPPPSPPETRMARCYDIERRDGVPTVMRYLGDRTCVDFDPPRRISGVWLYKFEYSVFLEGATSRAELNQARNLPWLTIDKDTVLPTGFRPSYIEGRAYRVTFEGRAAKDMQRKPMEGYGHFGAFPGLFLVDRVVSWEDLGRTDGR